MGKQEESDVNPAHGSGRIVQVLSTTGSYNHVLIPPTAVGGYFRFLLFILNPVGGVLVGCRMNSGDLNDPPTSVGGIPSSIRV